MPRAAITGQLPVLHLDQMALKQAQGPVQRHGITVRPLAPIQQGLAVALQQGHQVFGHHGSCCHSPGHGAIEAAAEVAIAPGGFDPLGADPHPIGKAQASGHGLHGGGLASDGIQQGHLCLGKGNGDGEAGEASPGSHINPVLRLVR